MSSAADQLAVACPDRCALSVRLDSEVNLRRAFARKFLVHVALPSPQTLRCCHHGRCVPLMVVVMAALIMLAA